MTPKEIAAKWTKRLGLGFHPDTSGAMYEPPLPSHEVRKYDHDMDILMEAEDPYALCVEAMEEAGLI